MQPDLKGTDGARRPISTAASRGVDRGTVQGLGQRRAEGRAGARNWQLQPIGNKTARRVGRQQGHEVRPHAMQGPIAIGLIGVLTAAVIAVIITLSMVHATVRARHLGAATLRGA